MISPGQLNSGPNLARFGNLINECRSIAVRELGALIGRMFENVNGALLDFADKAESNTIQGRFFEAMREIEKKRDGAKRVFEGEINSGFLHFARGRPLQINEDAVDAVEEQQCVATGFSMSGLRLVEKNAHEEAVVVQSLAAKSTTRYLEPLYALGQRLAIVNGGHRLNESSLPIGPLHILTAFRTAIQPLSIETNVKLVLYALFDRMVMTELAQLYQALNTCLVKGGILPHLKPAVRKGPASTTPAAVRTGEPQSLESEARTTPATSSPQPPSAGGREPGIGDQLFGTICELLAARRHAVAAEGASGAQGSAEPAHEDVAPYPDNTELVSAISRLQIESSVHGHEDHPHHDSGKPVDREALENIRSTLHAQRKKIYDGVDRRRVRQVEVDVIDVVGMLFDCVLNDELLPNSVKALLSRLHTPYLKVAVLDKQFFTTDAHPARRLLNAMADAGTRYVSEEQLDTGVFPQMQFMVNRILREYNEGLHLFTELLAEFGEVVASAKQKAEIIERRAREAANGHEKLQLARERAMDEIAARTCNKPLPPVADRFLSQTWADHLMFILLRSRDGERSEEWKKALRIAEEIVWAITVPSHDRSKPETAARVAALEQAIADNLELLGGYGGHDHEDLFRLLKDHLESEDEVTAAAPSVETETTEPATFEPHNGTIAADVPETTPSSQPDVVSPEVQEYCEALRATKFGTWFDFKADAAGACRRLKLSWSSRVSSNFMFVDQLGVKAAVYPILELARMMHEGRATIVEERRKPFFDWALEAIRGMLSGSASLSA